MPIKIMTVVGARPNFMKAAPLVAAIKAHNARLGGKSEGPSSEIEHVLVHTGQHYDHSMSGSFFSDLSLPPPDVYLGVGSASHAAQTAEIIRKFEEVILREKPDIVVVVGDVNSTVACALVTAKISFDVTGQRPLLAHVEAGLRSFDRTMPEECNRVVTDHLSGLLFVTEDSGLRNLRREGIKRGKIHFVGNTMIDSLIAFKDRAKSSVILDQLGLRVTDHTRGSAIAPYALLTLHRPSNVDNKEMFKTILRGLQKLAATMPVVFPAHPRTQGRIEEFGLQQHFANQAAGASTGLAKAHAGGIYFVQPLGYLDFLCLMMHARLVITDSGGIQEETTCLGVPCVTVRNNTERPVTVTRGTNLIGGTTEKGIQHAIRLQLAKPKRFTIPPKWDGKSAERIVAILVRTVRAGR